MRASCSAVTPGSARGWPIEVHLRNDGPSVTGELRLDGGTQSRTQYGTPVDLPTGSDKIYLLYAQPPGFGREIKVDLVEGDDEIASARAEYSVRDAAQLVVGIVAERPQGIVTGLSLLPNQQQQAAVTLALTPADLPSRVEAWSAIDRLVWQDVDSNLLEPEQLAALQGWLASGGRLVIAGGTAGPATLSAFPDTILPYRPLATIDAAPQSLAGLLGELPENAADVVALSGDLIGGRALASVGDRVVAAERPYGSGLVTIIGFDPATPWIAETSAAENLWRQLLPQRTTTGQVLTDDSQLISAVSQLPALALPPIGGLLLLLGAYILLIGPVNYLVLRRLDRREWAWVTMPILIVVFAAGAYGFGAALRGSSVIVNEIAIVRGAPGATDGAAQVYLGVFSPTRETYQLAVPGGALLSSPVSGEFFGGDATAGGLDILQGNPSRVRDLSVGVASLRAVRAETPATVPLIEADLQLVDGFLKGSVRNASTERLEKPAVVIGSTVQVLDDLDPGERAEINTRISPTFFGQPLSDKVVGSVFFPDASRASEAVIRQYVRHTMVDQLTYDPMFGTSNQLPSDGPVILAWGSNDVLDIEIQGQVPRRTGNVLYYFNAPLAIHGQTTFTSDLLRSSVTGTDSAFFNKSPWSIDMGRGHGHAGVPPDPLRGDVPHHRRRPQHGLRWRHRGRRRTRAEADRAARRDPSSPATRSWRTARRWTTRRTAQPELRRDARARSLRRRRERVAPPAAPHPGPALQPRLSGELRRAVDGHPARALRQRERGQRQLQSRCRAVGGGRVSAIVRAEGLVKRYDRTVAVAGVDLAVEPGEIFGLVGPNGAGKTTTLRILATLLEPSAGEAEICGYSVIRNPDEVRRVLGFMPDSFGVYDDMKVWEYLDFFGRCYGIPAASRRRMIGDLLDLVDLANKRDTYVQALSRGMQQRLCLAHALVHDPQVLLLDEPASGLDPRARVELRELLRELRALGKTIIISSHILPELEELCTSVAIVDHGSVLAQGRVADIERRLRFGAVLRVHVLAEGEALEAARDHFAADPEVASASILEDGTIELGFRGDDAASARLLASAVGAGLQIVTFSRAASDLEELFLQVTSADREPEVAA